MAEFKRIYDIVELLDSLNTKQEDDEELVAFAEDQDYMLMEKKEDLLSKYMSSSGLKKSQANRIYNQAKQHNFIDDKKPPYDTTDIYVFVRPEGHAFIFKRWVIPTGLIRQIAKDNRHISPIVSVVISLLALLVAILAATSGQ